MRMARSLIRSNTALWLQTFPAPEEFQRFKKSDANDEFIKSLVWFPDGISARLANRDLITDRLVDGKLMRSVLYGLFRQIKYDSVALDEAFSCLKAMNTLVRALSW